MKYPASEKSSVIPWKVNAFTIIEVTVAMLLAAISIGITYTAYSLIRRSYSDFDQKNQKVAELLLIDKLFKQDILAASRIIRQSDGLIFQVNEGEIEYHFTDEYILREQYQARTDTFYLANTQFLTMFENKESFAGEITDRIRVSIGEKKIPLVYYKQYSAEELFENERHQLR